MRATSRVTRGIHIAEICAMRVRNLMYFIQRSFVFLFFMAEIFLVVALNRTNPMFVGRTLENEKKINAQTALEVLNAPLGALLFSPHLVLMTMVYQHVEYLAKGCACRV